MYLWGKKLIYVEMYGRQGNQFFRYAAARALQKKYYPDEKLVLSFNQVYKSAGNDATFYNTLEDYNVAPYTLYAKKGKVIFNESSFLQKAVCVPYYFGLKKIPAEDMNRQVSYQGKWEPTLSKLGIYWYRNGFHTIQRSSQSNKFLSGNFESKSYFNGIRDSLLEEFTPKHDPLEKNQKLYEIIKSTNSVCVSVRRGDFESNEIFRGLHSVCHQKYFANAIAKAKQLIDNPTFIFFSDDIEWVKKNIQTGCATYSEDGTDPVWEKLRMMSMCKHFIISNSTFSWWAQYLSINNDKVVIAPSRWFNNDFESPLIEQEFIKIDV